MFEKFKGVCGIYKINFPSGKSYIGLSTNIQQRMIQHKKTKDELPVHQAIQKYGLKEENIEILEEFDLLNKELLPEREIYWINYFNTYNDGYNSTLGGEGASPGTANASSTITEEILAEIVQDLIENKILIKDLVIKYNLSSRALSNINTGKHYYNSNLVYPLRPPTLFKTGESPQKSGVENSSAKFNDESLKKIIQELKESKKTIKQIAEEFNCCAHTITAINTGKHYFNPEIDYPIRKKRKTTTKINEEQLNEILKMLSDTSLSFSEIGRRMGLNDTTIGRINTGRTHHNDALNYPIRQKSVSTISGSGE